MQGDMDTDNFVKAHLMLIESLTVSVPTLLEAMQLYQQPLSDHQVHFLEGFQLTFTAMPYCLDRQTSYQ